MDTAIREYHRHAGEFGCKSWTPFFYSKLYKVLLDKVKITYIIRTMKTINNLEKVLNQQGVTKSSLARELSVSRQCVNNWTRGKNYPNKKMMKLVSAYLEVSIEKLFFNGD